MIREARPEEFSRLREIEFEADGMFAEVGIGPFDNDESENHLAQASVVLAAEDPAVGFACVEIVDGAAHLWQLAVLPSQGRRGLGTALVTAVSDWAKAHGFHAVTLTTFRDVPWNGPFYQRLGFEVVDEPGPGLAAIRVDERAGGDDDFGPRIAMRKELRQPSGDHGPGAPGPS
ncbi:MAG TPA: GNAT family N-acetyltransferase [Acidimicrobiales bacterium]|jgi:GNAT superfamily N-acetyltransferase